MSAVEKIKEKFKQFGPTSWAVNNRTAVYIITIIISLYGLNKFNTLPKEQFPDIVVPTISVSTVYMGNSPKDIENLITRPIEKEIRGLTGAKINKVTSTSLQDFSFVQVEFDTDVKTDIAKQKIKDAVDKAKTELPNDLTVQPNVTDFAFSDFPIMFVNVSGDYDVMKLKDYAERLKDRFEELSEINKAEIVGAPEREIQINVDPIKMQAAKVSFGDIEAAVARENRDISGGQVEVGNMKRVMRIRGQFTSALNLNNIVVKNVNGAPVYLKDIADLQDGVKEKDSYARLNGKNVITLNVVKRAGENLINASEKINAIVEEMKKEFPKDLNVQITGDQSIRTKTSFNELINTIVIGFILVLLVLMFFMGVTNAFFVALSVPLSVFVAFMFLPLGNWFVGTSITLNFIVLFALLFGLGIIVDDAIVVIENTHRIYNNGKVPVARAAKMAAGEIFIPVLAGTLTTLAPFFPLLMWKGLIGKFMIYLPVMLILTLTASLIVAFFINPVFAVSFMKPEGKEFEKPKAEIFRKWWFYGLIIIGLMMSFAGQAAFGHFLIIMAALVVLNRYVLNPAIFKFQHNLLPRLMNRYENGLRWALKGKRPVWLVVSTFGLFVVSVIALMARKPNIVLFPQGDPNNIFVYLKMPAGTSTQYTDSMVKMLEKKVDQVIAQTKAGPAVESIISNVALGAGDPRDANRSIQSNLGRIQIAFYDYEKRHGMATTPVMDALRKSITGIPGATVTVAPEANGPPTDPPVNIEIKGDDFDKIAKVATDLKNFIDKSGVEGIEALKMNVDLNSPEVTINVNRERALIEGLSTSQIGMEIRTAVFGREVSKLKDNEDEYKIQLRYADLKRNNLTDLLNMKITYRDFNSGAIRQVPIGSVVTVDYTNTSGGIFRKQYKRTIALTSNVLQMDKVTAINQELAKAIQNFKSSYTMPSSDITIAQAGESEQQKEMATFLGNALVIALMMIFLILVLQFNSISKPFIVLNEIFFSVIGVFLGIAITGMNLSVIMVGVGIVGLAGIVVKNGILLIEFTDELRGRGMRTREAAIQAGRIRIIPVLLTALATMLGLIPLAVGLNIDFLSLLKTGNPHLFFGGDSVVFWGPLSWTIIFGLIFAFFMTLLMVPSMYLISERLRRPMSKFYGTKWVALLGFLGPLFFILVGVMFLVRRIQGRPVWMGKLKPVRKAVS